MTSLESFFQDGDPSSWGLIVDTSSPSGSLTAIDTKGSIIYTSAWSEPQRHSEVLITNFGKLQKNIKQKTLSHIFYLQGPGSFTGLRVGASFIKALSFSNGKVPITCISSFLTTAVASRKLNNDFEDFYVVIPSVGNKFFKAEYKYTDGIWFENIDYTGSNKLEESLDCKSIFSNQRTELILDKGFTILPPTPQNIVDSISPKVLFRRYLKTCTYLDLYPLYLRKSEAEEKFDDKAKL